MDILILAQQWAKNEAFASKFFIVGAVVFIVLSICFWKMGQSEIARSYIYPTLICGLLLMVIGVGLVYNNTMRYNNFPTEYKANPEVFLQSEIERSEKTAESSYNTIYKVIPILIIVAALLMIFFDKPIVRASCITTIAFLSVLLFVDSTAHSRIDSYNKTLKEYKVGTQSKSLPD